MSVYRVAVRFCGQRISDLLPPFNPTSSLVNMAHILNWVIQFPTDNEPSGMFRSSRPIVKYNRVKASIVKIIHIILLEIHFISGVLFDFSAGNSRFSVCSATFGGPDHKSQSIS